MAKCHTMLCRSRSLARELTELVGGQPKRLGFSWSFPFSWSRTHRKLFGPVAELLGCEPARDTLAHDERHKTRHGCQRGSRFACQRSAGRGRYATEKRADADV